MATVLIGLQREWDDAIARVLATPEDPVVTVPDVDAAIRVVAQGRPTLIVVQRPWAELLAACRALRAAPSLEDAQILAIVGEADLPKIDNVLEAGADDFYIDSLGEAGLRARLGVARRAAEQRLARRAAEADLERFFQMALDMLCVAGLDGIFKRVNPAWVTTLGWSAEERCSRPWLELVHPEDRQPTIAAGARLAEGTAVISFANRYRHRDGSYRWLEWQAVPTVDRGLIYATARDVTEQRRHEAQLEELTENLSTTLSSIGDGVIAVDERETIVRMNPVAEQLTGWQLEAARGRPLVEVFKIIHSQTRSPAANPAARVLRENATVALDSDTLLVRRDGTELPIADSCAPIRNAEGQPRGAVLVFRDISAAVRASQERESIQRQLIFSDRMASVGTLAAGMAHEINNPLSFVTSNLDLVIEELHELAGGSASARLRELEDMVQEARTGAERIRKIVRGLKTFSRGAHERRSVVDVREVLELSINMTFNEIRHRARLVKDYGVLPPVEADEASLGQVFINLLVNAAQAIPDGMTTDNEIRIVTSTDPMGRAVIEIRDTGTGMPAHLLERIFDPFFTTKPVGVGTGLGLSICRNVVASMGGELSVRSVLGRGTSFTVTLQPASVAPAETEARSAPTPRVAVPRASVLIVDDEPAVGVMLTRVLRDHDVTVTTRARDALEQICSGKKFDVILSDLMMPEMSGMELYDELVRRSPDAAERVVFISGGAFTPNAEAFLLAVPNERLEKPFDSKTVRSLVQRFVK